MNLQAITKFFCETQLNCLNNATKLSVKKFILFSCEIENHVDMIKNSCRFLQEVDFNLISGEEKNYFNIFKNFELLLRKFNNQFIPRDDVRKISSIVISIITLEEIYESIHSFNHRLKLFNEDMKNNLKLIKKIDCNNFKNYIVENIELVKNFTFFCINKIDDLLEINTLLVNECFNRINSITKKKY